MEVFISCLNSQNVDKEILITLMELRQRCRVFVCNAMYPVLVALCGVCVYVWCVRVCAGVVRRL